MGQNEVLRLQEILENLLEINMIENWSGRELPRLTRPSENPSSIGYWGYQIRAFSANNDALLRKLYKDKEREYYYFFLSNISEVLCNALADDFNLLASWLQLVENAHNHFPTLNSENIAICVGLAFCETGKIKCLLGLVLKAKKKEEEPEKLVLAPEKLTSEIDLITVTDLGNCDVVRVGCRRRGRRSSDGPSVIISIPKTYFQHSDKRALTVKIFADRGGWSSADPGRTITLMIMALMPYLREPTKTLADNTHEIDKTESTRCTDIEFALLPSWHQECRQKTLKELAFLVAQAMHREYNWLNFSCGPYTQELFDEYFGRPIAPSEVPSTNTRQKV